MKAKEEAVVVASTIRLGVNRSTARKEEAPDYQVVHKRPIRTLQSAKIRFSYFDSFYKRTDKCQ